jgi:putative protease
MAVSISARPEILAPAGNYEMLRAAVENGADAVYFGVEAFNARLRADNFRREDLPAIMQELHQRGVKGYLTLNILVFNRELEEARELLLAASDAGVDAVLIQDLGIAAMARQIAPDLPIHASTQMTLTCAESIEGARTLGVTAERVVTARELSRRELRQMLSHVDVPVEVFVHGAICVAYSGQCLTSEALGGRSANRGECAQACRLPYDLIVDEKPQDTGDLRYLLSPKDLAALDDVRELADMGIVSLKIEGRLKTPEYVAATVQAYRAAVDSAFGARPPVSAKEKRQLEATFSRGFTPGYLHEIDHQQVVEGRFPTKRGTFLGRVQGTHGERVRVRLQGPLKPGDGIVFDSGRPDRREEGGRVFEIFHRGKRITRFDPDSGDKAAEFELTFQRGKLDYRKILPDTLVWKTSDPEIERELRASFAGEGAQYRRPVRMHVHALEGAPLTVTARDDRGNVSSASSTDSLPCAEKHPLTEDILHEQLGRLGDTPFFLELLSADIQGRPMAPLRWLNELRRSVISDLLRRRAAAPQRKTRRDLSIADVRQELGEWKRTERQDDNLPGVSVLCRSVEHVQAALAAGCCRIYTDFEDVRLQQEARRLIPAGAQQFFPATLRIMKPGEAPLIRKILRAEPDGILVRNLGAWQVLKEQAPSLPLVADFSLNVANDLTARLLLRQGFLKLTPSYDLNIDQLGDLLGDIDPAQFELVLHQYMPLFHMEHCVFCRFLSTGKDSSNCGRPCEKHSVRLRDRTGCEHPVKADFSCRNTVFHAVAQSGVDYLPLLRSAGIKSYRIELLNESRTEAERILRLYISVLQGDAAPAGMLQALRSNGKLGVTRGSLDHVDQGGFDRLYSINPRKAAHGKSRHAVSGS